MKRLALALVFASIVPVQAEDAEFLKLRKLQQDAIARAITPINEGYVRELRKLLERQTRAGKLDDAKVTMEEIETIAGSKDIASNCESDKEFERTLTNTTWKLVAGSTITLKKGGVGTKEERGQEWPLVWRIHPPNKVEVTGNFNADGSRRTFFFRILSKREAYYGDTSESATAPLVYVR